MKIIDENTSNFEELNQRFSIVVLSQKNFPKIVRWSMNIFFEIFSGTLKILISAAAEIKTVSTRGHGEPVRLRDIETGEDICNSE